jgi:hypothetical protein
MSFEKSVKEKVVTDVGQTVVAALQALWEPVAVGS